MRKAIILTALVLMFILSTTSAFAVVGAEEPPEGMAGITAVDADTPVENELYQGTDPITEEPVDVRRDVTAVEEPAVESYPPEIAETTITADMLRNDAGSVTANNNNPVVTYTLIGTGFLAAVLGGVVLRKRLTGQGA